MSCRHGLQPDNTGVRDPGWKMDLVRLLRVLSCRTRLVPEMSSNEALQTVRNMQQVIGEVLNVPSEQNNGMLNIPCHDTCTRDALAQHRNFAQVCLWLIFVSVAVGGCFCWSASFTSSCLLFFGFPALSRCCPYCNVSVTHNGVQVPSTKLPCALAGHKQIKTARSATASGRVQPSHMLSPHVVHTLMNMICCTLQMAS